MTPSVLKNSSLLNSPQAITDVNELVQQFAAGCKERSDCGSFQNGGDLDFFGPGQMQKPFEEASFKLQVGEMSGIVDTDSGSHLILRIA